MALGLLSSLLPLLTFLGSSCSPSLSLFLLLAAACDPLLFTLPFLGHLHTPTVKLHTTSRDSLWILVPDVVHLAYLRRLALRRTLLFLQRITHVKFYYIVI